MYTILRTGHELKLKFAVEDVCKFADIYDCEGCPIHHAPHGSTILVKDNILDQDS